MKTCAFCKKEIGVRTKTISLVGGLFPAEDPDFFMVDETVMQESYCHMACLEEALRENSRS